MVDIQSATADIRRRKKKKEKEEEEEETTWPALLDRAVIIS